MLTTADRKRQEIVDLIEKAFELSKELMIDEDVWGKEQYVESFFEDLYFKTKELRNFARGRS